MKKKYRDSSVPIYEIHLLYKHQWKLSCENIISSHVKITREQADLFTRCYGYIINHAFLSGAFVKVVLTQLQNGRRFTY